MTSTNGIGDELHKLNNNLEKLIQTFPQTGGVKKKEKESKRDDKGREVRRLRE